MTPTTPLFIGGYPKSGTTLLLALLDHHPDLLVFPEETTLLNDMSPTAAPRTPEDILKRSAFAHGEVHWPSGYRDYRSIDFEEYRQHLHQRWAASDNSKRALLEATILAYGDVTQQQDKPYWVEKSPGNESYLEDALPAWPNLRAVYILRDPRDNFCSYRKHKANKTVPQTLRPAAFIADWGQSLAAWLAFARHHPHTLLINYTDLVSQPRQELSRLCQFLDIAWDDILLEPTRNGVFWSGNSTDKIKHAGISTAPLNKYRSIMTPAERHFFQTWLEPLLAHYGFEMDDIQTSWRDWFRWVRPSRQMQAVLHDVHARLGLKT